MHTVQSTRTAEKVLKRAASTLLVRSVPGAAGGLSSYLKRRSLREKRGKPH